MQMFAFFFIIIGSVGFSAVQDSSLTNTTFDFSIVNDYNDSDTCENHWQIAKLESWHWALDSIRNSCDVSMKTSCCATSPGSWVHNTRNREFWNFVVLKLCFGNHSILILCTSVRKILQKLAKLAFSLKQGVVPLL